MTAPVELGITSRLEIKNVHLMETKMIESPPPFLTAFETQVDCQPDAHALFWLHNGETPTDTLTYHQLAQQANAIATQLRQHGCTVGDRVLLVYAEGVAFLPAFLGCLYASVVAVPAPVPDALRGKRTYPHLQAIAADAQAALLLTTSDLRSTLATSLALPIMTTDDLATTKPDLDPATLSYGPLPNREQLAYLQYTSGSTGTPKGVMISHANLAANLIALNQAVGYTESSIALSWLPHTHDYGLVDGLLRPLASGVPSYLLSPWSFLRRPVRWLNAISRFNVTHSGGSAFAYHHCLQLIRQNDCHDLNLACWQVAGVGAEPVHAPMLEQFATTFAPYGFDRNAFCPGYGLAETTLIATCKARSSTLITRSLTVNGKPTLLTSCGHAWSDSQVLVVDPATHQPVSDGAVGEIWISGGSVAQGYWQRSQETAETFGAQYADKRYLRTGDLGIIDQGDLFIGGRLKDLVIIHGQNYHPQDLEWLVEAAHPLLTPSSNVVFSIESPDPAQATEQLVIVCEVGANAAKAPDWVAISQAISAQIANHFALPVYAITFIRRGTLPKTPSGKVQRSACRRAWLQGEWERLFTWQLTPSPQATLAPAPVNDPGRPYTQVELALLNLWRELLNVEQIGLHDTFFQLGGHSLLVMRLMAEVEQRFQQAIDFRRFIFNPTIAHLAALLTGTQESPSADTQTEAQYAPALSESEALRQLYESLGDQKKINQLLKASRPQRAQPRLLQALLRLPQPVALPLLAWATQQRWVQRHYWPTQTALVQQFLAEIEPPLRQPQPTLVARALFFGYLTHFGVRSAIFRNVRRQHTHTREDRIILETARAQGQGVILLTSHTYQHAYFDAFKLTQFTVRDMQSLIKNINTDKSRAEHILYARQLELARQTLQQGGAIFIAPDLNRGHGTQISLPLHGRMRQFRTSFAELALLTQSKLFFVASDLQHYNQFSFRLVGPLEMGSTGMSHEQRVQQLMTQYVAHLHQQWASIPWAIPWGTMSEHLRYPLVMS